MLASVPIVVVRPGKDSGPAHKSFSELTYNEQAMTVLMISLFVAIIARFVYKLFRDDANKVVD